MPIQKGHVLNHNLQEMIKPKLKTGIVVTRRDRIGSVIANSGVPRGVNGIKTFMNLKNMPTCDRGE